MLFSYNWLQSYFKQKLPSPEKLAEILTLHFAEVESVEKKGQDFVLDIDVRSNRASDCFSHLGIAREIAAILKSEIRNSKSEIKEDKKLKAKDFISVEVRIQRACPRYIARVITGVKVGPSPKWVKDRLISCGLRPINNVVDAANYVMLETGQPLHAFDFEKIDGKKIIVRFAKKGEKITTLDGGKYDLNNNVLVIADLKESLAIAGIKGGKKAEINEKTKTIVLESANFNQRIIRQASRAINLKTDASLRFEHGLDPNLAGIAIDQVAGLIQKIGRGKTVQLIDVYPKKVLPKKIKLDLDYVRSLLGIEMTNEEIKSILGRLGFKIGSQNLVEAPTKRLDVLIQENLIEEVGRIYGYEKIKAIFPVVSLASPETNEDIFWEDAAKNILKEAGFSEVYNYSFVGEQGKLELENPLSSEFRYLRPGLIPNLLKNIKTNQKNYKEIRIFELGKIFNPPNIEKRTLTGVITGNAFYEAKGVVDLLLNRLGIGKIWRGGYNECQTQGCAEIKVNEEKVGFLSEIAPKILKDLKIESKVAVFDLDFEKLQKLCSQEMVYRQIPKFPSACRDLAILVPLEVRVGDVLNKIKAGGGEMLRDIDLFDIYEGKNLPEGKKNLAFHLVYRAEDRTLASKEIDDLQNKIVKSLEENLEWQIRN
jgi:phenylalanyl-tRNA synthetase beta chain